MKRFLTMTVIACFAITTMAQSIKGPEKITYFQAPSAGVKFAKADVYISHDKVLEEAKLKAQQEKNSAMGSKFGALGTAVADAANTGLTMLQMMEDAIKEFQDDKGRFAVWSFVPDYIIAKAETEKAIMVEIFVLNEPNPSAMDGKMPTEADKDKNGYYNVPYYVNCRYKITDPRGNLILEENLGILQGKQKTKDYTPPPPAGAPGSITVTEDDGKTGLSAAERIGVNQAYNRVRKEVFARYGFGQFDAPIKLGVVKEIKTSKKLIKPTLDVFEGKKGLLLNADEKKQVQLLVDALEKDANLATEKTRWVTYHNLSVCYAWLENQEKATEYFTKYTAEIQTTLDKMDCWNKVLAGTMTGKEMKDKTGSTFIGMKDQKKYENYNNVKSFVTYYAAGATRYEKLFYTINRELAKFVDFYTINDLLCQMFEIDFPYQFFPLNDFKGAPKKMEGVITREGMEPITYKANIDSKNRVKNIEADQITVLDDGTKEKLITRDLKPLYNDAGFYTHMQIGSDFGANLRYGGGGYKNLNTVYDPLDHMTKGEATNITKNTGFMGDKGSYESVRLKVDLDGNIFFNGSSSYFKANAFFKDMLNSAGLVPKRVDTDAKFTTKANINEHGVMTNWRWEGTVKTDIGGAWSMREQSITAKKMVRELNFVEVDDSGNPIKAQANFEIKGSMDIESKLTAKQFFSGFTFNPNMTVNTSSEGFDVKNEDVWECKFTYDAQGNWTEMKMGPYTATRTFKY